MAAYPLGQKKPIRSLVALTLLTAPLWLAACGGSSPSAPDSTPAASTPQTTAVTYGGTFQSNNDSYGSITLIAQVPVASLAAVDGMSAPRAVASASGTLKPGINASIPLTGTYDTATGKFVVTGGGFTVNATVTPTADGAVLNGTVTTATTQGAVVALPSTSTGTVITYCGNFTGGNTGTLVVTRRDNKLVALVAEKGEAAPYSINGALNGTAVDLSFTWAPPDVGSTTVTGTLNGSVISGTWTSNSIEFGTPVSVHGDWVVRAGSCPL
jgi:hypothetical protein